MVTRSDERRFYHILIRVVFVAVTAASLIALVGRQFWVAELFTHFRLYYLLVQALLVLIFLHSGHRVLMLLTIIFVVPNIWAVMPYVTPIVGNLQASANIESGAEGVDIVALNVNYRNDEYARVAGYLRDRNPDIIVLAEFTPAWRDGLAYLGKSHPYQLSDPRPDQWGLAIFSRLPLVDAQLIELAQTDAMHARFIVALGTMQLEIFAVHLFSPTSSGQARDRNLQLEDLADRVKGSPHQHLVIGDMNLTPFSPYFDRLLDQSGLRDARRVDGFHVTWPASALPIWIPIDHALVGPQLAGVRVDAGPNVGSDHLPLQIFVPEQAHDLPGRDKTHLVK